MKKKADSKIALRVDPKDNVATLFATDTANGAAVEIQDKQGNLDTVIVIGSVPYGHKIAACDIREGEHIIKYGETIGAASKNIKKGEYVHIHNMVALRGRGDLNEVKK